MESIDLPEVQSHYSYSGTWRNGVRDGFGIENFSIITLQAERELQANQYIQGNA